MPDIQVIKLKVRRGLNSQRRLVVLDEGELGYTTDTERLFIGTGKLSGGVAAAPKIHGISSSDISVLSAILSPEIGDIVSAKDKLYQFTNTYTWEFIGTEVDEGTINYNNNNKIGVTTNSINASYLNQSQLSSSSVVFDSGRLNVNYNTSQFTISSSTLSIAASGIKPIHIDPSIVSRGLAGGGGRPLSAFVDNVSIGYNASNQLAVIGTPISAVSYSKLLCGFDVNPINNNVSTQLRSVDSNYLALNDGMITLNGSFSAEPSGLNSYVFNDAGLMRNVASSIYDILSCDISGSLFNGAPNQVTEGYIPSNSNTIFNATSTTLTGPVTVSLSSAGFIVFEYNGLGTRNNPNHKPDRLAIPVFTF